MGKFSDIIVDAPDRLTWQSQVFRCALGRGGILEFKAEGDGATPAGKFPLRRVFYRPDKISIIDTSLQTMALSPDDGWCDAPADPAYNQLIKTPFARGHEALWRDDNVYDIIVELGYNDAPVVPGRGSAIFMHIAKLDYAPTEGCVALRRDDLLAVLASCTESTHIQINPASA